MKYAILTFGCRVNQADSLGFEEQLLGSGARPAGQDDADLVIVNTCSVTASADQAARQAIRRVGRINPRARIVATGCYATRRPEELSELPGVAAVVPNDRKADLLQIARPGQNTATRYGDGDGACGAAITPGVMGRTAFTLQVQTGCDQPCAYCVIPTTRGTPRSRTIAALLDEIARVAALGFKEIALTGVHLGSYGHDLSPACTLVDLLASIERQYAGGDRLFRISSLEPMDCSPAIVSLVASSTCFAPHFHLPLQHASHTMLRAMRRPYTPEYYAALVADIRMQLPHAAIGSDVIVGFPGERDRDFEALAAYLEASPLTHLHVFPYSDRPGTAASTMPDKVAGAVVRDRGARLREISARLATRFKAAQRGTVRRALTIDDGATVVTGNYLKLAIAPGLARNEWVTVQVADAEARTAVVLGAA